MITITKANASSDLGTILNDSQLPEISQLLKYNNVSESLLACTKLKKKLYTLD